MITDPPAGEGGPPHAAPAGRREQRKQRTRDDLYDAALELFTERPYDAVSVEDICERAEVGRATFFRFYGTKSGLLVEFNRRLAERTRAIVADAAPATSSDAIRLVQQSIVDSWRSGGPMLRDITREYIRTVTLAAGTTMSQPDLIEFVAEIVRTGQESGEFRSELKPEFIAWTIVTTLSGAAVRWGRTEAGFEHATAESIDLLLRGLSRWD